MNQSEPLPQDVQQAIDQLAERRTVTVHPKVQVIINISQAIQSAGNVHNRNEIFRAAVQAIYGPMNWS